MDLFAQLQRLIAVHEEIEDLHIHPVAIAGLPGGKDTIEELMMEEAAIKRLLSEMESIDPQGPDFAVQLYQLHQMILRHNGNEEHMEYPCLLTSLDVVAVQRVRQAASYANTAILQGSGGAMAKEDMLGGSFPTMLERARMGLKG